MDGIPKLNLPQCMYYHQINECPFIEDNVKQIFAKHFQNLNLEPTKTKNHGYSELEELYHERVKIPNRFREQIWRDNKMEMKVRIVANVVHAFVAPTPSLLHHNNVGVTYPRISNLRMEPIRSILIYFVTMPQSMVIVIEVPFVIAPTHIVVSMRSKPQTLKETQLVSVHT